MGTSIPADECSCTNQCFNPLNRGKAMGTFGTNKSAVYIYV